MSTYKITTVKQHFKTFTWPLIITAAKIPLFSTLMEMMSSLEEMY